ncbi:polyketide synthase dehydratase domain-containing protein, partial [Frankia canadensis]|uniref:polyketide synthase dehydratase domain-containing protein n=1 Tax=Frankia canadensis TaxID=1836972 RepID=UPI001A9C50F2
PDTPWTTHATGTLTPGTEQPASFDLTAWPPSGAKPIDLTGAYERLAERSYKYGPAFQGLQAAWRLGDEIFAEVRLSEDLASDAGNFEIHPALLDAALHPLVLVADESSDADTDAEENVGPRVPFSWSGVTLYATGATALRVRLTPTGPNTASVLLADTTGAPVAAVDTLALRAISLDRLSDAGPLRDSLFGLEWVPLPGGHRPVHPTSTLAVLLGTEDTWAGLALPGESTYLDLDALSATLTAGEPVPATVVVSPAVFPAATGGLDPAEVGSDLDDVVATTHSNAEAALRLVQQWLAEDRFADSRLVVVTRGATAADGIIGNLAQASLWGLIRSAQAEHPDRFVLADLALDGDPRSSATLLLDGLTTGEPQFAVRDGQIRVPRLARVEPAEAEGPLFDPEGTVLITGGTGTL